MMDKPVAELRRAMLAKRRLFDAMLDVMADQEMMELILRGISAEEFADLLAWAGSPLDLEDVDIVGALAPMRADNG